MNKVFSLLKSSAVRLLIMMGILAYCLSGIPSAFEMYLNEIVVEQQESSDADTVRLLVKGGNLLRANSFYLNREQVQDAQVERSTYAQCFVTLDKSLLECGKWYQMEVGFSKWNIIHLVSPTLWVEWTL